MQRLDAVRELTQITGLCKTTHTLNQAITTTNRLENGRTQCSEKSLLVPTLLLCSLDDKSYPGVNILRIIELIVICKLLLS